MKSFFVVLTLSLFSIDAFAVGENCYQISNHDSQYYCVATAKKDKSYCFQIRDNDKKNFCVAMAGHDKSYCYQIQDSEMKKECAGQF